MVVYGYIRFGCIVTFNFYTQLFSCTMVQLLRSIVQWLRSTVQILHSQVAAEVVECQSVVNYKKPVQT